MSATLVPEWIGTICDQHPNSVALSRRGRHLTYKELNEKADQFAHYLAECGVVHGSSVAICLERSFEWIIAALGIMRASAAFVPLDPSWPDSRLRQAIEDSGARALVSMAPLLNRLRLELYGIDIRRDAEAIAHTCGAICRSIIPEDIAYVIYTSGSTGVPKGVEITHANLAHLAKWHQNAFCVTSEDRASHLAGLGFDAAVWEVWPNLCAGATVCLADDADRSSPELIQGWMLRERISIGFVPTVHASSMMALVWPDSTPLRLLLTGGDVLHRGPHKRLPFDVVNNYGPTECTVVATSSTLHPQSFGIPPIGRPIQGTSIYLLDEHREQVPDGRVGEIYIGGAGVGHGYRNLSELTEQRFLPDHFAKDPMARLYRTGDRGVRRANGEIQFLGRLDRQVKIRDQRVELDEIESVLSQHPMVNHALATTQSSATGEKELVAYILPKEDGSFPHAEDLRRHLLQTLPDYMVPTVFVRLRQLPLAASGKCDPRLLPQPRNDNILERVSTGVPRTDVEEKILAIVRVLLRCDEIGVEDNFFLAGGHSLLGMQLVLRLSEEFGVEVTLQQLLEAPSVGGLALLVKSMRQERLGTRVQHDLLELPHFELEGGTFNISYTPDPIAPPQTSIKHTLGAVDRLSVNNVRRHDAKNSASMFWVHYLNIGLRQALGSDQRVVFVTLTPADIDRSSEPPTLQHIARCLLRKIMEIQPIGPYTLGGLCIGGVLAYEIAVQLRSAGQEVDLLVLLDPPSPSYLKMRNPMTARLTEPRYLLRRFARLGLRKSILTTGEQLIRRISSYAKLRALPRRNGQVQRLIENAAASYHPDEYKGQVLLLLASDRAPHVNFLPEWQALIPHTLHTHYISAHHSDLLKMPNAKDIADVIRSHLGTVDAKFVARIL